MTTTCLILFTDCGGKQDGIERAASRDLFDLWALGLDGYSEEAVQLFQKHGPAGGRPRP